MPATQKLRLGDVETEFCNSGLDPGARLHPGATLLIYDTFGGLKSPIVAFCAYLVAQPQAAPSRIIDPPMVEEVMAALKRKAAEQPLDFDVQGLHSTLGGSLAQSLAGSRDDALYVLVTQMLRKMEDGNPPVTITLAELKYWVRELPKCDSTELWGRICNSPDLFFVQKLNDEERATLRIKWWKFSEWWRQP